MAIYDTGTASLSASGHVTGAGTQWMAPLTLIRVGATIIFKTDPVQIYTISEITSDTSLSVHNPSGETAPAGTGYAILAHDGISVQGLAQDVAETLRYYQSNNYVTADENGNVEIQNGGTGASSAPEARDKLGLGSVATLDTVPVANGGTGATNAADARDNLELGSAATLNTGNNNGNAMRVGDFGLGRPDGAYVFDTPSQDALLAGLSNNGLTVFRNNQQIAAPWDIWNYSPSLFLRAGDTFGMISIPYQSTGKIKVFSGVDGQGWTHSRTIYDTQNTTVDSGGFLKVASPIVKVFSDGRFETNEQSDGVSVERVSIGVYKISGVLGLNSEAIWGGVNGGFEIPSDVNKQPRIWLDYEVNADGSILMKTYHRTHDSSPSFASNVIEGFINGDPMDIPSDAFVSIRVNMP